MTNIRVSLPPDISETVNIALQEDVGDGDLTASLINPETRASAQIVCREDAVLCGAAWFEEAFRQVGSATTVEWTKQDGDQVAPNDVVCKVNGFARDLVTAERTALNFLQTLSATATITHACIEKLAHSKTKLLDTRKTVPGLRSAQKYAVACGGGTNHRVGLFDGILIKENHIQACGSITDAIIQMRAAQPTMLIEIEVETMAELDEAIVAGADILLLDNFAVNDIRAAVERTDGRAKLEASGGFEIDELFEIGATGVDFVSVGALTKHIRAIDYSMRFGPFNS